MDNILIVSNLILWVFVIGLAFLVFALTRQIGVLYERVAPAGALMINKKLEWDPAEGSQGAIGKIDFEMDVERGGAWTLAVKQGEYVWFALAKRAIMRTLDPFHIVIDCLEEADFVALPGSEFVIDNQPVVGVTWYEASTLFTSPD